MLGLSITAIGMRSIAHCLEIFQTLQTPMKLEYLELAIGSPCAVETAYPQVPLVLHDVCLYQNDRRLRLSLLQPKTWQPYAAFIATHDVRAVSLHPPLQRECTRRELETALTHLQKTLTVPVHVEVMPSMEYWCSSLETLVEHPLLLDVSHVLIWFQGDRTLTEQTCRSLLATKSVGAIHLSHNNGQADAHDLIPVDSWFSDAIAQWSNDYLVTFESLPVRYSTYERLDKRRLQAIGKPI